MAELRLLLVDDEVEFLEPMAARLARRRISCTTARNGEEALKELGKERFHCAVVDVRMSGMDGLELLRKMRWNHPDVPVILLTGHASVELGVQGMELGDLLIETLVRPVEKKISANEGARGAVEFLVSFT